MATFSADEIRSLIELNLRKQDRARASGNFFEVRQIESRIDQFKKMLMRISDHESGLRHSLSALASQAEHVPTANYIPPTSEMQTAQPIPPLDLTGVPGNAPRLGMPQNATPLSTPGRRAASTNKRNSRVNKQISAFGPTGPVYLDHGCCSCQNCCHCYKSCGVCCYFLCCCGCCHTLALTPEQCTCCENECDCCPC